MQILMDQAAIIAIVALVAVFMGLLLTLTKNYHKVAPNQVAIISGRQRKLGTEAKRGYRVVTGGSFFLYPVLERVDYLFLNVMTFQVQVQSVPDRSGVLVDVHGIANVKVQSDESSLALAVERFLGFDQAKIMNVAKENLESNLRSIVGTLTIEQMNQERQELQGKVMHEAASDLNRLGLGLDLLNIQSVSDQQGYITSLGKKRTAEVQRDATIGEAEAQRDSHVKAAEAKQIGDIAKANSEKSISDAQRDRDVAIAKNQAFVEAERARIQIAAQVAAAGEQKNLNVAEVAATMARTEAETKLQEKERERRDAELKATVVVTAERQKDARIIAAQGEQEAAEREGEALRIRAEKEGLGHQAKAVAEAKGRTAQADADRAELLAKAAGREAGLLAEAAGTRAMLLAEAEGAMEKAKAFKELDDAGRFLMILQASPAAIAAMGDAISKAITPAADAIGKGLGNIDEVRVIDMGGRNGDGNLLGQFASMPVETIVSLLQKASAAGFGPVLMQAAKKAGLALNDGTGAVGRDKEAPAFGNGGEIKLPETAQ